MLHFMELSLPFEKLWQVGTKRLILLIGLISSAALLFQFLLSPYDNVLLSLIPANNVLTTSNSISIMTKNKAKINRHHPSPITKISSISDMILLLHQRRASFLSMVLITFSPGVYFEMMKIEFKKMLIPFRWMQRPQSPSVPDQEILSARSQIVNVPIVETDPELHASLFQNLSAFKRSYELMEDILKVYVYEEGEKPIFHQPPLEGIYASEGWFMKHIEANKQFVVKNPSKAHLFYIPFSSQILGETLYVPNSHSSKNLIKYLKDYVHAIAAKHPFWDRTGGADHFLAACHDWAPKETRRYVGYWTRALCNADVSENFIIGKDVSLPETYVRSASDPLRDLGGKPPLERQILALLCREHSWKSPSGLIKILGEQRS